MTKTRIYYYADKSFSDRLTNNHFEIWGNNLNEENIVINFSDANSNKPFHILAQDIICDYHFVADTQCLPLYRYNKLGNRVDNITAYALKQFQEHYADETITRLNIFHYIYAVLHHPAYREKYKLNLKREFPRIPFYQDFWQWAGWGQTLMELHLNYETAPLYPLQRVDTPANPDKPPLTPKAKLKADKTAATIELDTATTLKGVPPAAWAYKLGNRSALEWVLEYHKERKPRDPTIREKFNTYRLADYKEQVIELLQRVCTVSVETMRIIGEMGEA